MSAIRPRPKWLIEDTHPDLFQAVDAAFREVIDPEIGLNIMELGLIRDVSINEKNLAHVVMIMTTPFCPYAPALLESARLKAAAALERETSIEMGMEYWDPSYMEDGVGADWGLF